MTRGQIKTIVSQNLADAGVTYTTDTDLNDSLQDAYDDIACLTQCIVKNATLNWVNMLSYYNFEELGVADYMVTLGIFNNVTNQWLRDDLNLRDLDRIRRDWENWTGASQFWCPSDPHNIAVAPKYVGSLDGAFLSTAFSTAFYLGAPSSLGTFRLLYAAIAPLFSADSDVPLIATDMQDLFQFYSTGDMLEAAEEFNKANEYWEKYYEGVQQYAERVKRINKADLLLRI